jgi:D-3-phosphoglycerate dehydrogenase
VLYRVLEFRLNNRMATFKVVLIEHGYASTQYERDIIEGAGGELIDAESLPREEALRLCEEADGILFRRQDISRELIQRFRRCKVIVRYGVGTDNVDTAAATEAGMIVGHVPVYCVDEVTSQAFALLLACVRHVVATHKRMELGAWDVHRNEPIYRMEGKTIGLVGLGKIGQGMARKLSGWGLRVLAADPFVEETKAQSLGVRLVSFEELCRESDFVSLHVPLLPETRHLINPQTLQWMKRGVILVNTARGPVIDLKALLGALSSGQVAWAGLDVFEEEPLPADSPFRAHPRVVVSDHTAWYSEESQVQLQQTVAREVARVCTGGLPESLANPEVLKRLGRWEEWTPSETVLWQLKRLEKRGGNTA